MITVPADAAALLRRVQLHRNNAAYRLLLSACELVLRSLVLVGDTQPIDVRTMIRGHRVHVRSLRLSQPWDQVAATYSPSSTMLQMLRAVDACPRATEVRRVPDGRDWELGA